MKHKLILITKLTLMILFFACFAGIIIPFKVAIPLYYNPDTGIIELHYDSNQLEVKNRSMRIKDTYFPADSNLSMQGYLKDSDANHGNWNTAYGWGNHALSDVNFVKTADNNYAKQSNGYIIFDANRVSDACGQGSISMESWVRCLRDTSIEANNFPVRMMEVKDSNQTIGYVPMFKVK